MGPTRGGVCALAGGLVLAGSVVATAAAPARPGLGTQVGASIVVYLDHVALLEQCALSGAAQWCDRLGPPEVATWTG